MPPEMSIGSRPKTKQSDQKITFQQKWSRITKIRLFYLENILSQVNKMQRNIVCHITSLRDNSHSKQIALTKSENIYQIIIELRFMLMSA